MARTPGAAPMRGVMPNSRSRNVGGTYAVILGGLVLIVVTLTGGLCWYNSTKTAELAIVASDRLIDEIGDKVLERVQLLYDPMIAIVALAARVPDITAMTHGDDPPATAFLMRGLKAYPQIFSLYVGYANGDFFMVSHVAGPQNAAARATLQAPDGTAFANERIALGDDGVRHSRWVFLDDDGVEIGRSDGTAEFDPRQRPWYQAAIEGDGSVKRTRPYMFASSQQVGVTLSSAIQGRAPGVFGADLAIGELARFLGAQAVTASSRVFVFNGDGTIVAYPEAAAAPKAADGTSITPGTPIAKIGDPVLSGLFEHFRANGATAAGPGGTISYDAGDREYLARITPIPERYGQNEFLAVTVPVDEIVAPIAAIRTQTLVYSSLFLVLTLPLYCTLLVAWIDRRLARAEQVPRYVYDEDEE
jgi:adenylate cyclase